MIYTDFLLLAFVRYTILPDSDEICLVEQEKQSDFSLSTLPISPILSYLDSVDQHTYFKLS